MINIMKKYVMSDRLQQEISRICGTDERMVKYYHERISNECVLECGKIVTFDKPRIQTSFCFGYSHDSTGEDLQRALDASEQAKADIEHFMERNMKALTEYRDMLTENRDLFWHDDYHDRNIVSIYEFRQMCRWYPGIYQLPEFEVILDEYRITPEDRKNLLAVVNEEIAKFEKRLKSYLKRYGLSKISSWTYWRDE